MNTTVQVFPENKYTELNLTVQIPFCNNKEEVIDVEALKARQKAYNYDLIGSFSKRIIASLQRRLKACQENLIRHLDDVEYSDECGHIVYVRKDKTRGNFNVPSFRAMQDAIKALENSCWQIFLENKCWIDQTIKALLNDTEQDHSNAGTFKYSELVSLLCELHEGDRY